MTPEKALILRDFFGKALEQEAKTTRRVLEAIPATGNDYRPDPKARTGLDLGWHIASIDAYFLNGILAAHFDEAAESQPMPADIQSGADLVAYYDKHYIARLHELRTLDAEKLIQVVPYFGAFHLPLVMYLWFLCHHQIHHRGQLSTYLRPMGSKVPSIYGGSADETFQMPASG